MSNCPQITRCNMSDVRIGSPPVGVMIFLPQSLRFKICSSDYAGAFERKASQSGTAAHARRALWCCQNRSAHTRWICAFCITALRECAFDYQPYRALINSIWKSDLWPIFDSCFSKHRFFRIPRKNRIPILRYPAKSLFREPVTLNKSTHSREQISKHKNERNDLYSKKV